MEKPKEFGVCYILAEPLQVLPYRLFLTGLIMPVSLSLWGCTCKELSGRGEASLLRSVLSRDEEVPSALLSSSDLPSLFCILLSILKNMSSPVSTDVKKEGGVSFAEGVESIGGWVRRAGGAEGGCICLQMHLAL